ncbi:hypothetical protein ACFVSS_25805 [Peribacillus butanolivorans]|uniref:hypothetical protein n=1 Tax=Peribacillus butanolivorans TaxID=421767 RepID=UPI0036D94162
MDLLKDVLVEVAKTVANSTVVYLFSFLPAKKVKRKPPVLYPNSTGGLLRSVRFRSNRPLWIGY